MRFKDKTYLITLLLFLLFLNTGIFSLAYYTQQKNINAAETLAKSEQSVIAKSFEDDITYLGNIGRAQVMESYGSYYIEKDIGLCFYSLIDSETKYTNLPKGAVLPPSGSCSTQRINGKRIFFISETIANGQYRITYAKDITYLDEDFKNLSMVYIFTSLGASALLAFILFFVLHKLSGPLERLSKATQEFANGNFAIRADESGKDEFSLLAADFNRMAEHIGAQMNELEENAEIKQRMLDNLAHEMRTPLTSIRGYAEYLLNANISDDEKIEATEFIISEAERLKLISERLLDDAFIRANGIQPEKTNLGEITANAVKKLAFTAASSGVELRVSAKSVCCVCDSLLVGMAVTNLIGNAIKACKGGGKVEVSCYCENEHAVISVCDNGIGMTEEQLKRITEPFYRTDKSRNRADGGTGLGLALCDRIATAHGAELRFESKVGEGTKAFLRFPITQK